MFSLIYINLLGTSSFGLKTQPSSIEHHINFRMGTSSATTNGQPTLCLEGGLPNRWSVETCGTGTGFIHHQSGLDLMHMRGKYELFERTIGESSLSTSIGAGFAEIQVGNDELGFQFNRTRNGIETSGPEISSSMQWMIPIVGQSELIIDTNIGAAYFEYAPDLRLPQPKLFPFVEFSAGFGW